MKAEVRERIREGLIDLATFPFERPMAWVFVLSLAIVTWLTVHGVIL